MKRDAQLRALIEPQQMVHLQALVSMTLLAFRANVQLNVR